MMKNPLFIFLVVALWLPVLSFAQSNTEKPALLSPLLLQYDLHYVKLDISMNNSSTQVAGKATLKATVTATSLSEFAFELDSVLTIDSVVLEGLPVPVARAGNLVTTSLPATLATGQNLTADIYYHGATPSGNGFFTRGLVVDPAFFTHSITFSLSDRFLAKDWWPCKQDIRDKIDSVDIWITVPDSVQVASNGKLKNITAIAPGQKRFEWQTRYPIAYYLISVAIMPYETYERMAYYEGDSMKVVHYLPDVPGFLAEYQPALDTVSLVLSYFSEKFGRYPFWNEKYGQAFAPLGGGMEHQTMTTIGPLPLEIMAHELAHQWWGDAVTFETWADIWLSEGFATYGEHLFLEHFHSAAAAKNWRTNTFNNVMMQPGGSVFVDDTTTEVRVFDGRLTYAKGGSVVHMLRHLIDNDSLFFLGLREYLSAHAYGNGSSNDLMMTLEAATGRDLDTFFNQWVYGEGYPRYHIRWNQMDGITYLQLTQTGSTPSSIDLFHTPVELLLKSPAGDMTVRLYNNQPEQIFAIPWDKTMTGLTLDPDKNLLCRQLSAIYQPNLGIQETAQGALRVSNNPTQTNWQLSGLNGPATILIKNLQGQTVYKIESKEQTVRLSAANLPEGHYILVVQEGVSAPRYFRLIRY